MSQPRQPVLEPSTKEIIEAIEQEYASWLSAKIPAAGIDALARAAKAEAKTIRSIRKGEHFPVRETVKKIAKALGEDPEVWLEVREQFANRIKAVKNGRADSGPPTSGRGGSLPSWLRITLAVALAVVGIAVGVGTWRALEAEPADTGDDRVAQSGPSPASDANASVIQADPGDTGRDVSQLPAAAGEARGAVRLVFSGVPYRDEIAVDIDTGRVGAPNEHIDRDEFYYRSRDDRERLQPVFRIRHETWLSVVDETPADGEACLAAVRERIVDTLLDLAEGQHLCIVTADGLIVGTDVDSITTEGELTLTGTAWEPVGFELGG